VWSSLLAGFVNGGPDPLLGSATAVAAHPGNNGVVYTALRTTGLYTLSGGTTWVTEPGAPTILMPQDLQFDTAGANLYYTVFNSGGVYRRNAGSWALIEPSVSPGGAGAKAVFQSSTGSLIATMYGALPQRSTSGAPGTWSNVAIAVAANDIGFMPIAFNEITEKPGSAGATLVASTNRGLYRSANNGATWSRVATAGPASMHTALSAVQYGGAASPLWAADRSGAIYCSTDDGTTWVASGKAAAPVVALKYMNGQLHALTDGAGVAKLAATCP
jgi:hypothetical protein